MIMRNLHDVTQSTKYLLLQSLGDQAMRQTNTKMPWYNFRMIRAVLFTTNSWRLSCWLRYRRCNSLPPIARMCLPDVVFIIDPLWDDMECWYVYVAYYYKRLSSETLRPTLGSKFSFERFHQIKNTFLNTFDIYIQYNSYLSSYFLLRVCQCSYYWRVITICSRTLNTTETMALDFEVFK